MWARGHNCLLLEDSTEFLTNTDYRTTVNDAESAHYRDPCISVIAAFVTAATKFNQPRCLSADEGIRESVVHMYTMGLYSAIKKNEVTTREGKWMQLDGDHYVK